MQPLRKRLWLSCGLLKLYVIISGGLLCIVVTGHAPLAWLQQKKDIRLTLAVCLQHCKGRQHADANFSLSPDGSGVPGQEGPRRG